MPALNHSDVFPTGYPLRLRRFFTTPGTFSINITSVTAATWLRVSMNAAGGFKDDAPGWGGAAAFAFDHELAVAGVYTGQVGDSDHARTAQNDVLGDSWVKRPDTSIFVYADRGRPGGAGGLVANCTGSIKRAGGAAASNHGGASAGDDADDMALGFGGQGASASQAAYWGGGGGYEAGHDFPTFPAGDGAVCFELFTFNPGY